MKKPKVKTICLKCGQLAESYKEEKTYMKVRDSEGNVGNVISKKKITFHHGNQKNCVVTAEPRITYLS